MLCYLYILHELLRWRLKRVMRRLLAVRIGQTTAALLEQLGEEASLSPVLLLCLFVFFVSVSFQWRQLVVHQDLL